MIKSLTIVSLLVGYIYSQGSTGFNPREDRENADQSETTTPQQLSIVSGRFNIQHSSNLRCGSCTVAGFIFCYKKSNNVDAANFDSSNSACCSDT